MMSGKQGEIIHVEIIFFTGTGGTKRIVDGFEQELTQRELEVSITELNQGKGDCSSRAADEADYIDLRLLIFPVYAFDAPKPIYDWIERTSKGTKESLGKVAVISVSGGGEIWPNTGCRWECCQALERKGYEVVYDRMMCMPANIAVETNDHVAMWLIKVIPQKVNLILDDILAHKVRRTYKKKSHLRSYLTKTEKENSHLFTNQLEITDDCKLCGWCIKNCPVSNIKMSEQSGKPEFSNRCTFCVRCVYGCPYHAIKSKSPIVLKKGFDLKAVEERMEGVELIPVEKCCKGFVWKGVRNYLQGKD